MERAIMIRVKAEDFDTWLRVHNEHAEARREYGITDGPLYRDAAEPDVALVTLYMEDLGRAMEWFRTEAFRRAVQRAGRVQREFWVAEKRM